MKKEEYLARKARMVENPPVDIYRNYLRSKGDPRGFITPTDKDTKPVRFRDNLELLSIYRRGKDLTAYNTKEALQVHPIVLQRSFHHKRSTLAK